MNVADVEDDVHGAEDEYNSVAFVSPVMVQWRTLNSHYP